MNEMQKELLLRLLIDELVKDRDVVRISKEIRSFEEAFREQIPTWKTDLQVLLKQHPVGYTALHILQNWK